MSFARATMAENQEMSPIEMKVARQIEVMIMSFRNEVYFLFRFGSFKKWLFASNLQYYFGDHNLPRDKFLKEQLQLDDGWVPFETMLKFNRYFNCQTASTAAYSFYFYNCNHQINSIVTLQSYNSLMGGELLWLSRREWWRISLV